MSDRDLALTIVNTKQILFAVIIDTTTCKARIRTFILPIVRITHFYEILKNEIYKCFVGKTTETLHCFYGYNTKVPEFGSCPT